MRRPSVALSWENSWLFAMDSLQTSRLWCQTVTPAHFQDILRIYQHNQDLLLLLEQDQEADVLAMRFVRKANLPPSGRMAQLCNVVVYRSSEAQAVGLCSVYQGYPEPRTAYIGELFFDSQAQRMGLGRELYTALEERLRHGAITAVRVGVGLRNWNALRFWIRLGFVHITGMSGARDFSPQAYAFLELQKNL